MAVRRDAAYWREYRRAWRAAHREVENARKQRWRAANGREHGTRPSRALPPLPELHTGHPFMEEARRLVPQRGSLATLRDPLVEDLRSEAVLAMIEGRDPVAAIKHYRASEMAWAFHIAPLFLDAFEGRDDK